jgi:hypothetical protein
MENDEGSIAEHAENSDNGEEHPDELDEEEPDEIDIDDGFNADERSFSPPADHVDEETHTDWNDASYVATPHRHRRRGPGCNSTKFRRSPSQHRRRLLRRRSSGGSDA